MDCSALENTLALVCKPTDIPVYDFDFRRFFACSSRTSRSFEVKVEAAELLGLLKEFPNSRSLDLQQRLRQALRHGHAEVLQHLIEKGLEAMDDGSIGDDDGSVGQPVKPASPPPSGGTRQSPIPRNEGVDGR